ncbi:uncharacterized protein HMPREF1541_03143 [Cyphellophora europaea CBS 101466]|uniref:NB-ARC domain-containing protein n=1 Tax=Cyphellophora europaea (strain CBS 101466) TaxID=1220924 RepID=W2RZJ1_CYPE1|nr:uncharacterized protein HMPREF1541_03143 [Cyphellophora europaea CBS 101466]ETN41208.1 hypothetical protein HMPREF1541_03143 [Cyphellophora europaea CBS 101466]
MQKIVQKDNLKSGLDGDPGKPCEKNHRSIARFESPDDQDYISILHKLREWMLKDNPVQYDLAHLPTSPTLSAPAPTQRPNYFEVEAPTPMFTGRSHELERLKKQLPLPAHGESTGMYGPGTIGKTHLALKFAEMRQNDYRTVALFDGTSEAVLRAGMDRFFDMLVRRHDEHLHDTAGDPRDVSDRPKAVTEWFESEVDWLLIIDNLDLHEENPVPIKKYLPRRSRGHQLLISRNSDVTYHAKFQHQVGPVSEGDAFDMLVKISRLSETVLTEDRESINRILDEVRGIPGAIEMAAKYIKGHCDRPSALVPQLLDTSESLRTWSTRNERGKAFAIWHLAYDKLEEGPQQPLFLLQFLAMLNGSQIPRVLFNRIAHPVPRWAPSGEVANLMPQESLASSPQLSELLLDKETFEEALTKLKNSGFLSVDFESASCHIQIHTHAQMIVQDRMGQDQRLLMLKLAICVLSHAFPEDPTIDNDYQTLRSSLTLQVLHCVKEAKKHDTNDLSEVLSKLITMLLSALERSGNEQFLLEDAERFIEHQDDGYYRCLASRWRAYMHHRLGEERLMQQTLSHRQNYEQRTERSEQVVSSRAHAALGNIIMHRAQFLTKAGLYEDCENALGSWVQRSGSMMENHTMSELKTASAVNLYAQGDQAEAIRLLSEVVYPFMQSQGQFGGRLPQRNVSQRAFNWAAISLCQIHCRQGTEDQLREVMDIITPLLAVLMPTDERFGFAACDYRILECEVLLRGKHWEDFQAKANILMEDLTQPPIYAGHNPRREDHQRQVKHMLARYFHMRGEWSYAVEAWTAALASENVDRAKIESNAFKDDYKVCICVLSLAVCLSHSKQPQAVKTARVYFEVLEKHVNGLKHPAAEPDATRWLEYLYTDAKLPSKFQKKVLGKALAGGAR